MCAMPVQETLAGMLGRDGVWSEVHVRVCSFDCLVLTARDFQTSQEISKAQKAS